MAEFLSASGLLPPAQVRQKSLSSFKNVILVALVGLLLLLNYGFMQIKLPFGIPISEIGLLIAMISIQHLKVLPRFFKIGFSLPVLLWWLMGLVHILWDAGQYGFWAIRDGSHVIESLFLYLGFTFARNEKAVHGVLRFLPVFFYIVALYGMTYPMRDWLQAVSPKIIGPYGQTVPLFFMYTNTAMIIVAGAAYFLNHYLLGNHWRFLLIAGGMLSIALLLFPSRTLIIEMMLFIAYFAFRVRGSQTKTVLLTLAIPLVVLSLVSVFGISVNGRYGTDFMPSNYQGLIMEIIPGVNVDETFTSGTEGRINWWADLLTRLTDNPFNFLFGLGYGMPLINFQVNGGVLVREPHNDLLSIFGRGGFIMLLLFVWFQVLAVRRTFKLADYYRQHPTYSSGIIGLLFILIGVLAFMIGEAPFIMSFFTVPYYFILGFMARLYLMRKQYV